MRSSDAAFETRRLSSPAKNHRQDRALGAIRTGLDINISLQCLVTGLAGTGRSHDPTAWKNEHKGMKIPMTMLCHNFKNPDMPHISAFRQAGERIQERDGDPDRSLKKNP